MTTEENLQTLKTRRWTTLVHLAEAQGVPADPFHGALLAAERDREAGLDVSEPEDAASALEEAERADALAAQAEAERANKRGPYEADPLFMYLWKRGFGTNDYEGRGLVRRIDRWVARIIGFDAARADYHILLQRPERLRRHAERLRSRANDEAGAAERAARELITSLDEGSPWRGELAALDARIAEMETA